MRLHYFPIVFIWDLSPGLIFFVYFPSQFSYYYALVHHNSTRIHRGAPNFKTGQQICSIIFCTRRDDPASCGIKFSSSAKVHQRFQFATISLELTVPVSNSKIMPNTLSMDLQPIEKFTFSKYVLVDFSVPSNKQTNKNN